VGWPYNSDAGHEQSWASRPLLAAIEGHSRRPASAPFRRPPDPPKTAEKPPIRANLQTDKKRANQGKKRTAGGQGRLAPGFLTFVDGFVRAVFFDTTTDHSGTVRFRRPVNYADLCAG